MHVNSDRDPVEIREGTVYYQLDECFSYKGSSYMMRIYLLYVCVVISDVSVVCEVRITQVVAGGPRKIVHRDKRLGGQRSRFVRSLLLSMSSRGIVLRAG